MDAFVMHFSSALTHLTHTHTHTHTHLESDVPAKSDITRDSQVVKFQHVWDAVKSTKKLSNLPVVERRRKRRRAIIKVLYSSIVY